MVEKLKRGKKKKREKKDLRDHELLPSRALPSVVESSSKVSDSQFRDRLWIHDAPAPSMGKLNKLPKLAQSDEQNLLKHWSAMVLLRDKLWVWENPQLRPALLLKLLEHLSLFFTVESVSGYHWAVTQRFLPLLEKSLLCDLPNRDTKRRLFKLQVRLRVLFPSPNETSESPSTSVDDSETIPGSAFSSQQLLPSQASQQMDGESTREIGEESYSDEEDDGSAWW